MVDDAITVRERRHVLNPCPMFGLRRPEDWYFRRDLYTRVDFKDAPPWPGKALWASDSQP